MTFRNCKCGLKEERSVRVDVRKKHKSPLCFWSLRSLHILEVTTTTTSSSPSLSLSSPMAWPSSSVTSINLRTADRSNRGSFFFCRSSHMGRSRWSSKRLKVRARLLKHQYFYHHIFTIIYHFFHIPPQVFLFRFGANTEM